ncbi:hypothetical protein OIE66_20340 [Nonomuraea sp. NBC_01738]|uniref:hypothetical protein n=1 Tax=Nonomuraea sp. NBC_01738 TaxID=2976003 RepID=UPI002E137474|nr:hypothetical protein OIE66_20340 [Nonomuraea sp. NBC_01738]
MSANPEIGGATLESVNRHEELVELLARRFALADLSLRELESRADKLGGTRLPRATCADMLAGRRFPRRAVMLTFLRVCGVPQGEWPAWDRAWERVRVSRLPAGMRDTVADEPPQDTPPEHPLDAKPAGPTPADAAPRPVWERRAVVVAAVTAAVLVIAVALGVVIGHRTAPRAELSGRLQRPVAVGPVVTDDGRAFGPGGSSRFTVRVDPGNRGVRLVRRLDAGVALQQAAITVNGAPAGRWAPLLGDTDYKWRDQVVELPPALTAGHGTLTVVNTFVSGEGFNEFRYTVEQRSGRGWTTADTLDVGPGHRDSEAAHGYVITGEGWEGAQTFAYPPAQRDRTVR